MFERTLPEVWAARWRHQAQEEGWQTEGEKHIGASVCKQTPGGDWNHGKVVGYGGDGEDDRDGSVRTLNSHSPFISDGLFALNPEESRREPQGEIIWKIHWNDYDTEDLNLRQLTEAMDVSSAFPSDVAGAARPPTDPPPKRRKRRATPLAVDGGAAAEDDDAPLVLEEELQE